VSSTSQPAGGTQHAPRLGQRRRDVLDVLVDLGADGDVEVLIRERQRERIAGVVFDGRVAAAGAGEHALARLDAVHATVRADLRGHLGGQEAGAGADVEHALARPE
jgi:hypothetical protein